MVGICLGRKMSAVGKCVDEYVLTKCGNDQEHAAVICKAVSILEAVASLGTRWWNVPVIASDLFSKA